jgi:hypothetical protein
MKKLICLYSFLGRQNMYLLCPEGMKQNEGVRVINPMLEKLHSEVSESLPKGFTGGQFQTEVLKRMLPLLKTSGFEVVNIENLPRTRAWNN